MLNYKKLKFICVGAAVLSILSLSSIQPVYAEWKSDNKGYMYEENNINVTGWKHLDYTPDHSGTSSEDDNYYKKVWYFFDHNGYMLSGVWVCSQGKYYYLRDNGVMVKNCTVNGCALGSDGAWIEDGGWKEDSTGWWYSYGDGNGYATGWKAFEDIDKYKHSKGLMDSGDIWYYFDSNGYMKTGWVLSDGKWYYLNNDGAMARDCTIDGYMLDYDGAWIEKLGKVNYSQDIVTHPEKSVYPLGTTIMNYTVINNTGKVYETSYGPTYVEKYEDGKWVNMTNTVLEGILNGDLPVPERVPLDIEKIYDSQVNLTDFKEFDSSKPGKYRIVFGDDAVKEDGTKVTTLFEEFELK